jgi:hypothetical protein
VWKTNLILTPQNLVLPKKIKIIGVKNKKELFWSRTRRSRITIHNSILVGPEGRGVLEDERAH